MALGCFQRRFALFAALAPGVLAIWSLAAGDSALRQQIVEMEQQLTAAETRVAELEDALGRSEDAQREDGSRVPTKWVDGELKELPFVDRLRHLERKVDGSTNWVTDPMVFRKVEKQCMHQTTYNTDHAVCLDKLAKTATERQCVVYDLGIRKNPEFGYEMLTKLGCKVRAYDPSPISQDWWKKPKERSNNITRKLKEAGANYKFFPVGVAGEDGFLELFEYDWGQVSIYRAEYDETLGNGDVANVLPKSFSLPVTTLPTMMKENNDTYIDVLKIDVEGSEYMFLQDMFDRMGCPPVGQLAIEWHHFSSDQRYGSPPEITALHNLMSACGFKAFYNRDHWRTDLHFAQGNRKLPPFRYTLASYCKDC